MSNEIFFAQELIKVLKRHENELTRYSDSCVCLDLPKISLIIFEISNYYKISGRKVQDGSYNSYEDLFKIVDADKCEQLRAIITPVLNSSKAELINLIQAGGL